MKMKELIDMNLLEETLQQISKTIGEYEAEEDICISKGLLRRADVYRREAQRVNKLHKRLLNQMISIKNIIDIEDNNN